MNLANIARSAIAASAIFAAATTWGDCNCNKVPPAPMFYPSVTSTPGYAPMSSGSYSPMPTAGAWSGYPMNASPTQAIDPAYGTPVSPALQGAPGAAYNPSSLPQGTNYDAPGPYWAPGGYEPRNGSPNYYYDPAGGQFAVSGNPYNDHWGPGYHRNSIYGHYSFPYYSYRRPWYYPGRAVYNRNTNFPW